MTFPFSWGFPSKKPPIYLAPFLSYTVFIVAFSKLRGWLIACIGLLFSSSLSFTRVDFYNFECLSVDTNWFFITIKELDVDWSWSRLFCLRIAYCFFMWDKSKSYLFLGSYLKTSRMLHFSTGPEHYGHSLPILYNNYIAGIDFLKDKTSDIKGENWYFYLYPIIIIDIWCTFNLHWTIENNWLSICY